jgi:hypothetical protein
MRWVEQVAQMEEEEYIQFWSANLNKRDRLKATGIDEICVPKYILNETGLQEAGGVL